MTFHNDSEAFLLEQARAGLSLTSLEQGRHLSRLQASLSRGATASVLGDPALEGAALSEAVAGGSPIGESMLRWLWKVHPLALVGGGLVAGGLVGILAGSGLGQEGSLPRAPVVVPTEEPSFETSPEAWLQQPSRPGVSPENQPAETASKAEEASSGKGPARPAAPENSAPEATFYEELSYLRRAQAALRAGNPTLALGIMSSLDEIQKTGAMDVERRVTKTLALCALDRREEARAVAAPIIEQDDSVYAERLRESCVGSLPPAGKVDLGAQGEAK